MTRAVPDTNVIVSGIAGYRDPSRRTGRLIHLALDRRFTLVMSSAIADETLRVLTTKRYFRREVPEPEGSELVSVLVGIAEWVSDLVVIPGVAPHWHDDAILATVAASGADWFVTGDRQLLAVREYAGAPFTDPPRFLAILDASRH